MIALLTVYKRHVYVSGIRNFAVEFLKATLISFLFYSRYYWFREVRRILFRETLCDCGRNLFIFLAMKDVRESQKYFDFGQRLRFIAVSEAINIYRFVPRLLRYGGTSRVREPGSYHVYIPRTFPRRKIWNAARISELKLKSTFSGLRGGSARKIRGIIYSATRSHSGSDTRLLRFNRFRSFSPKRVAYLRTIECTHSWRKRERYDPQIVSGWSRRRRNFTRCTVDNLFPSKIFCC